jgi:predicted nuclease of predicted toxin-antitoxin system
VYTVFLASDGQPFPVGAGVVKGFLLDENLPHRLRFTPSQPICHASDLGSQPTDDQIWAYAQSSDLVIVTKDTDFSDRILVSDPPPWVIHLRIGNLRRRDFHNFLEQVWPRVESYLPASKLINVYLDRIETVS